jgi:hypothetical protein
MWCCYNKQENMNDYDSSQVMPKGTEHYKKSTVYFSIASNTYKSSHEDFHSVLPDNPLFNDVENSSSSQGSVVEKKAELSPSIEQAFRNDPSLCDLLEAMKASKREVNAMDESALFSADDPSVYSEDSYPEVVLEEIDPKYFEQFGTIHK